jgi:outer membrane protein TolC
VPAARQVGRLGAVSVYGGVTYQTTLDSQRLSAARAQADYEVRIAQSNLKLAVQALQSQASQLLVKAEQARVSVVAATQTLEVTNLQAQNERQRFALGAATPLDVQVAEEALRQAQLRVVRARVDRVKSWLSLAHASGELLRRHPVTASASR